MIICAAVKFCINNNEVIIPCIRHSQAFEIVRDLGYNHHEYNVIEEGFLTHKNVFLNRNDAFSYASEIGQLSAELRNNSNNLGTLYSEDLW